MEAKTLIFHRVLPRASRLTNDSYCITSSQSCLLARSFCTGQTINTLSKQPVNLNVVNVVPSAPGHSQKKEISPGSADCYVLKDHKLKYVKGVSCVTQLSCVQHATNAQNAASNLPVGARLQNFWQILLDLGAGPKVVQILKEGYTLPFRTRPISHSHKLLCQSPQEQLPDGAIASAYRQERSGASTKPNLSGVLQAAVFGPKVQQQVETYIRSEQTESFPQGGKIQNVDAENHQDIPPTRGVGCVNRLQGCLLPYPHTGTVQKISQVSCPGSDIPVQGSAFRSVNSTLGVHCSSKGGKTDGHTPGYKNPLVPRRLVGESYIPPGLSPAHPRSSTNLSRTRLASEFGQIGTGTKASLRFCRLPVRPHGWSDPTDTGPVAKPSGQHTGDIVSTDLSGPAIHVPDRFTNSHRKASSPRVTAYETYTWHLKNNWRIPESLEKVIPIPRSLHLHLR